MLGRDKKMNPGRYFIPNMGMGMQMGPMMNGMAPMTRGVGLFGRAGTDGEHADCLYLRPGLLHG